MRRLAVLLPILVGCPQDTKTSSEAWFLVWPATPDRVSSQQLLLGGGPVLHALFELTAPGSDAPSLQYSRSEDDGITWSQAVQLSQDLASKGPLLSATDREGGLVVVTRSGTWLRRTAAGDFEQLPSPLTPAESEVAAKDVAALASDVVYARVGAPSEALEWFGRWDGRRWVLFQVPAFQGLGIGTSGSAHLFSLSSPQGRWQLTEQVYHPSTGTLSEPAAILPELLDSITAAPATAVTVVPRPHPDQRGRMTFALEATFAGGKRHWWCVNSGTGWLAVPLEPSEAPGVQLHLLFNPANAPWLLAGGASPGYWTPDGLELGSFTPAGAGLAATPNPDLGVVRGSLDARLLVVRNEADSWWLYQQPQGVAEASDSNDPGAGTQRPSQRQWLTVAPIVPNDLAPSAMTFTLDGAPMVRLQQSSTSFPTSGGVPATRSALFADATSLSLRSSVSWVGTLSLPITCQPDDLTSGRAGLAITVGRVDHRLSSAGALSLSVPSAGTAPLGFTEASMVPGTFSGALEGGATVANGTFRAEVPGPALGALPTITAVRVVYWSLPYVVPGS